MTKLLVGLGNPGDKYFETKHNVGFMLIDQLAKKQNVTFTHDKIFQAELASFFLNGEKIYLVKYGSEKAVKEAGRLREEGKEYIVQDGDIMEFRFNV